MPQWTWGRARLAALVMTCAVTAGCAQLVNGSPIALSAPAPASSTSAAAALPTDIDALAATVATALQGVWRSTFPQAFGKPWRDIASFTPVHTGLRGAAPPCVASRADVREQAYYCPAADAVVWDADALLPDLNRRFGAAGVIVVLAHEIGHAVQSRLGLDAAARGDAAHYPTILLETMADCYAGVAVAQLARRPTAGLQVGPLQRDDALLALVGFSDPIGVQAGDGGAHGDAFDRVSAFQDGYGGGATTCAAMTVANREFTQRRFGSAADAARRGDLPMAQLVAAVEPDARAWFTRIGAARTRAWSAPPLIAAPDPACPTAEQAAQGPVRFCAADGAVSLDRVAMAPVHRTRGDYADAVLIISRYGLALRAATGQDPTGPAAGAAAACLAGAYTGRLLTERDDFGLSPGDLDEAVSVLLGENWAVTDARGAADPDQHGFERVGRFRAGVTGGPAACGI